MNSKTYLVAAFLLAACGSEGGFSEGAPEDDGVPLASAPSYEDWTAAEAAAGTAAGDDAAEAEGTQKSGCFRNDWVQTIRLYEGHWGSWSTCPQYCAVNSFAYRVNLKAEAPQGTGDDSSVNAVSLHCFDRTTGAFTGYVTSDKGTEGDWLGTVHFWNESTSTPLTTGKLLYQTPQAGNGDDVAGAGLKVNWRTSNSGLTNVPSAAMYGYWRTTQTCPDGTAVCGIRTQVHAPQGSGDDTALNGVEFECCSF